MEEMQKFHGEGSILSAVNLTRYLKLAELETSGGSLVVSFQNDILSLLVGEDYHYLFENKGQTIHNISKVSFPTELGVCLEINDDAALKQSYGGVKGGITIDIDARTPDYFPTTSTKGFVVFIRDQDETVMLNQGGYVISPGKETYMKLTAR